MRLTTAPSRRIYPGRPLVAGMAVAVLVAAVLTACSTSGNAESASTASSASETSTPTANATAAATEAGGSASETELPTGVPTAVDPCDLITSTEASQLAGTTFGDGTSSTTATNVRECIYGSQTVDVFTVTEVEAPDDATVEAAKAQVLWPSARQ